MEPSQSAKLSLWSWALAAVLVLLFDLAITQTSVLWGATAFENTRDLREIVFAQSYRVARKLYAPRQRRPRHVVALGNSRIFLAGYEPYVDAELERLAPTLDVSYADLGIFGAGLGDVEAVSRHLGALGPELVIVTVAPSDLLVSPYNPIENVPSRLFGIGWRDGPIPARSRAERVDRWARTIWPLYRFREFTRAVLTDQVFAPTDPGPMPAAFANTRALFDYMHGKDGARAERAYRAWRRGPTLENFVRYLEVGSGGHLEMVRGRVRTSPPVTPNSLTVTILDALLGRIAATGWRCIVLVMPENPILAEDAEGLYHRRGLSEQAVALFADLADRNGARLVDARSSMPAEAFIDFDHPMPDLSGFQQVIAEEILHAFQ